MKKNITNQIKYGASLIALAFSLSASANVQAQSCATPPTCDELGYTRSASECATPALKCPFSDSKYYCLTADELGELGGGGKCDNPNVGTILYSDGSCNGSVQTDKTAIAIVFNPTYRLAIALQSQTAYWSTSSFDVPELANKTSDSTALADWAGRANTTTVINYCKANGKSCPAFDYVNSYQTAGTKAGDWYLPALGELNDIYSNKAALNRSLSLVGGTQLPTDYYHWSSSENSGNSAWGQYFPDGGILLTIDYKNATNYVRPVLRF